MKRGLLITVGALAAATLACNIGVNVPRVNTGPTQTLTISEPVPSSHLAADVQVTLGAGTLNINPGAQALVEGQVQYNVADWKPTVTRTADGLTITQGQSDNVALPASGDSIVNDWSLKLGQTPITLTVGMGSQTRNQTSAAAIATRPIRKASCHSNGCSWSWLSSSS